MSVRTEGANVRLYEVGFKGNIYPYVNIVGYPPKSGMSVYVVLTYVLMCMRRLASPMLSRSAKVKRTQEEKPKYLRTCGAAGEGGVRGLP